MSNLDEAKPIQPDIEKDEESLAQAVESSPPDEGFPHLETEGEPPKKKSKPWVLRIFFGILIFLLIVALGAVGGILKGTNDRVRYENEIVGTAISDQFVRGLIDMQNENYEIAIERFKYILNYDPNHVGAQDQLTKALLELGARGSLPTLTPTATLTPTPDFRNEQELYNQALAYSSAQDWDNLIATLDDLTAEKIVEIEQYEKRLAPISMFYMIFGTILPTIAVVALIVLISIAGITVTFFPFLFVLLLAVLVMQVIFYHVFRGVRPLVRL